MDKFEEDWRGFLEFATEEEVEAEVIGVDHEVTKDILVAFGGPTAYLRFIFNLNGVHSCCWDSLTSVEYHSNEVDYGVKTEWKHHYYDEEDMKVLWDKYKAYLEDYDD